MTINSYNQTSGWTFFVKGVILSSRRQLRLGFLPTAILVSALLHPTPETLAGNDSASKAERWNRVLQLVGDGNRDDRLDVNEIESFLVRLLKTRSEKLLGEMAQFVEIKEDVLQEHLEDTISRSILTYADRNRSDDIEIGELARLEQYEVGTPFNRSFQSIFLRDLDRISPPGPDRPSVVDRLAQKVSVRQSFLDRSGVAKPASLTWMHRGGDDETVKEGQDRTAFEFRGAISIKPTTWASEEDGSDKILHSWSPVLVVEADLSSDESQERDSIVHRFGLTGGFFSSRFGRGLSGHNFDATFDLTTDNDYDVKSLGGTVQYTPNFRRIGIGEYLHNEVNWAFRWRPYVGLTYADVDEKLEEAELRDFADFFVRITGKLQIVPRIVLTPDFTFTRELRNAKEEHSLFEATLSVFLDEKRRFSLDLSYIRGERSPEFVEREATTLGLGIKF